MVGCAKELSQENSQDFEVSGKETQQTKLSLEDAIGEVENLLGQIDNRTTRANGSSRKIGDYYCVGKRATTRSAPLSEEDDIVTYIFNFENDEGYAIVVGDTRIEMPVMLITDDGYLNPEEEVDNPGLINFLNLAENYCNNQILQYEEEVASVATKSSFLSWMKHGKWIEPWKVAEQYGRRTFLNWDQRAPFNNNIKLINGQLPPLGCTATATMLLMAWHKYPNVYDGHSYNWNEMLKHRNTDINNGFNNPSAYSDLARLSEIITRKENLDMSFSLDGSGAWLKNIPRTLKRLGYYHGGTYADWNKEIVLNELKEYPHYPVAVSAYAKTYQYKVVTRFLGIKVKTSTKTGYEEGHSFLLENAICRTRKKQHSQTGRIRTYTQTLVYVNYGWSGGSNGYYDAGVFDTSSGPVTRSEGTSGYYQYNVKMVYGVRK